MPGKETRGRGDNDDEEEEIEDPVGNEEAECGADSPTEYFDWDATVALVCLARPARAGDLNLNSEALPDAD